MDKELEDAIRDIDTITKNEMQILKLQAMYEFKNYQVGLTEVWTLKKKRSGNLKTDQQMLLKLQH